MGADYDHAKPTNELWTFTLATQVGLIEGYRNKIKIGAAYIDG